MFVSVDCNRITGRLELLGNQEAPLSWLQLYLNSYLFILRLIAIDQLFLDSVNESRMRKPGRNHGGKQRGTYRMRDVLPWIYIRRLRKTRVLPV